MNNIYTSQESIILPKMLKELTLNVPYRFLLPFFEDKLKGQKKAQKMIEEFSSYDTKCIYEIYTRRKIMIKKLLSYVEEFKRDSISNSNICCFRSSNGDDYSTINGMDY